MAADRHPKLTGIDLDTSFILGVIYDDDSLTLEMDFHLLPDHPRFEEPDSEEGCYRKGYVRFADVDDLRLRKTRVTEGEDIDLSVITTATIEGEYAFIESGWGEIELTAKTIQIAVD